MVSFFQSLSLFPHLLPFPIGYSDSEESSHYYSFSCHVFLDLGQAFRSETSSLLLPSQLHWLNVFHQYFLDLHSPGQLSCMIYLSEGLSSNRAWSLGNYKMFMLNIESVFCTLLNNSKCLHIVKVRRHRNLIQSEGAFYPEIRRF